VAAAPVGDDVSALEPGLYSAIIREEREEVVFVDDGHMGTTFVAVRGQFRHLASDITDARPLIVLDLGDPALGITIAALRIATKDRGLELHTLALQNITDQIEAQTKPARIPEPGLWGVVEAALIGTSGAQRFTFINGSPTTAYGWLCNDSGQGHRWDRLIDPTLIREGVAS